MPDYTGTRFPLMTQGGFSPSDLGGGKIWYRYDKGITIATGASQWDDQFSEGNHAKQATGADQPLVQSDGSLLFDGISQFLKADAFTFVQPETVYILVNQKTWANNDNYIFDGNAVAKGIIYQLNSTPENTAYAGTNLSDISPVLDTYNILTAVFNGASSVLQLNNDTPVEGDAGANDMGGFTLGSAGDGGSRWANIQVKEVAGYSGAHDAVTRARMIQYLSEVGKI